MRRLFLLPLLLPTAALAQPLVDEINYHYFEVGYLFTELDMPGDNLDGRGPGGFEYSFGIRRHLHLFAGMSAVDYRDVDAKARNRTAGIGTHFNLGNRLSLFGRLAYTDLRLRLDTDSNRDDGGIATVGARFLPAAGYEIRGSVSHRELDDAGGDTSFNIAGDIYLTHSVALTIEFRLADDENAGMVGGRFYFGRDPRMERRPR